MESKPLATAVRIGPSDVIDAVEITLLDADEKVMGVLLCDLGMSVELVKHVKIAGASIWPLFADRPRDPAELPN